MKTPTAEKQCQDQALIKFENWQYCSRSSQNVNEVNEKAYNLVYKRLLRKGRL